MNKPDHIEKWAWDATLKLWHDYQTEGMLFESIAQALMNAKNEQREADAMIAENIIVGDNEGSTSSCTQTAITITNTIRKQGG